METGRFIFWRPRFPRFVAVLFLKFRRAAACRAKYGQMHLPLNLVALERRRGRVDISGDYRTLRVGYVSHSLDRFFEP